MISHDFPMFFHDFPMIFQKWAERAGEKIKGSRLKNITQKFPRHGHQAFEMFGELKMLLCSQSIRNIIPIIPAEFEACDTFKNDFADKYTWTEEGFSTFTIGSCKPCSAQRQFAIIWRCLFVLVTVSYWTWVSLCGIVIVNRTETNLSR